MAEVLDDIAAERRRQVALGYDAAHDDAHATSDMVAFIVQRTKPQCMTTPVRIGSDWDEARRGYLVEIAALAVAAIESIDRRAEGVQPAAPQPEPRSDV